MRRGVGVGCEMFSFLSVLTLTHRKQTKTRNHLLRTSRACLSKVHWRGPALAVRRRDRWSRQTSFGRRPFGVVVGQSICRVKGIRTVRFLARCQEVVDIRLADAALNSEVLTGAWAFGSVEAQSATFTQHARYLFQHSQLLTPCFCPVTQFSGQTTWPHPWPMSIGTYTRCWMSDRIKQPLVQPFGSLHQVSHPRRRLQFLNLSQNLWRRRARRQPTLGFQSHWLFQDQIKGTRQWIGDLNPAMNLQECARRSDVEI